MYVAIIDLETYGSEENLFYKDYKYLKETSNSETDEEIIDSISLNPFLSHIISACIIKLYGSEIEESKIEVFYLTENRSEEYTETIRYMRKDFQVKFIPLNFSAFGSEDFRNKEKELIARVLEVLDSAEHMVSYNGKKFDIPFLRIRSLKYGLKIPRIIEDESKHTDLIELLFRGKNFKMRFYSLDFVARNFDLKTPKEKVDGSDVKQLFKEEKYETIAKYNALDTIVLAELYLKISRLINGRDITEEGITDRQKWRVIKEIEDFISLMNGNKNLESIVSELSKRQASLVIEAFTLLNEKLRKKNL